MKFTEEGLKLIKEFEGFSAHPYQDQGGKWTIGFGTTAGVTANTPPVTPEQAETLLLSHVTDIEKEVSYLVRSDLNPCQYSGLVCFTYNVGAGNLRASTLLTYLNSGAWAAAADEFLRWDKCKGIEVPGLLRRRQAERALFLTPVSTQTV